MISFAVLMAEVVSLSALDLVLASILIPALGGLTLVLQLGVTRQVLVAATRTVVQLLLVGLILKWLFEEAHPGWLLPIAFLMVSLAGYEVMRRQKHRFRGGWGWGIGTVSMLVSSFTLTLFVLIAVIGAEPWYRPQYAIPLLGMTLGNTMNGIALGLNHLNSFVWDRREAVEGQLMLGRTWSESVTQIRRDSLRTGLIPIVNSMAVAGLISLPGMMTGQILAGSPPLEAVKYQILIMFLVASGTGFGTLAAVWLGSRRLFDERQRLRLDRLRQ